MFFQSASDYILSSQMLCDKRDELETHFGMPPFFLCAHAFELLLKAYLRAKGWSLEHLATRLGHDMSKVYRKTIEEGLQSTLSRNEVSQIDLLASLGITPHFHSRYTQIGGLAMPKLPLIYKIYEKLDAEIRPIVEADFECWRRNIIGGRD